MTPAALAHTRQPRRAAVRRTFPCSRIPTCMSLLAARKPNHSLPRAVLHRPRHLPARPRADLVPELALRRARLRAAEARQLRHPQGRPLLGHHRPRHRRRDPRLPQHLPPPRLDPLPRSEGHQPEDRLPLPPVDLRARRPAALGPRHGRGLRPVAARPEARPLPRRQRPRLHLPRRRRPAVRRLRRAGRPATSRRTTSPTPRSPTRAPSSRRATGSSSGRTTASATTAPATTRR